MQDKKKIMEKVRALLAKTTANGCTEEEALAAMSMARKLMDKYGVTQAELEAEAETFGTTSFAHRKWGTFSVEDRLGYWVARYCDVKVWRNTNTGEWSAHGGELDREFFQWLLTSLSRFAEQHAEWWLTDQRRNGNAHYGWQDQKSFVIGCVDRINERLKEEWRKRQSNLKTTDGKALVVLKMQLVEQSFHRQVGLKLRSSTRRENMRSSSGFHAGRATGDKASLNRPVNGGGGMRSIGSR
ncbi:MAG: DUF2786 domain-containing protein [Nitratireductor sp.]|nr:DUF2786 domain-containing protein [Nitratireductor sp.]